MTVPEYLETIQKAMYDKADASFREHRLVLKEWEKVIPALNGKYCPTAVLDLRQPLYLYVPMLI